MADQQAGLPPAMAAAMGQQQLPAQGPPPPAMLPVDPEVVCEQLLRAIETCAQKGPGASVPAEVNEYAKAAFSFAQAYVQIHPGLMSPQGVAPQVIAASAPVTVPPESNAETAAEGGAETPQDKKAESNG